MSTTDTRYSLFNYYIQTYGKLILEKWKDEDSNGLVDKYELKLAYDSFQSSFKQSPLRSSAAHNYFASQSYLFMTKQLSSAINDFRKNGLINSLNSNFVLEANDVDKAFIALKKEREKLPVDAPLSEFSKLEQKYILDPFQDTSTEILLGNKKVILITAKKNTISTRDISTIKKIENAIANSPGLKETINNIKGTIYLILSERAHTIPYSGYSLMVREGEFSVMLTNNPLDNFEGTVINEFNEVYDEERLSRKIKEDNIAAKKFDAISTALDDDYLSKLNIDNNPNLNDFFKGFSNSVSIWGKRYLSEGTKHKLTEGQKQEIKEIIISRIQRYINSSTSESIQKAINFEEIFKIVDSISAL